MFEQLISEGFVSLTGSDKRVTVKILRDTTAYESFILGVRVAILIRVAHRKFTVNPWNRVKNIIHTIAQCNPYVWSWARWHGTWSVACSVSWRHVAYSGKQFGLKTRLPGQLSPSFGHWYATPLLALMRVHSSTPRCLPPVLSCILPVKRWNPNRQSQRSLKKSFAHFLTVYFSWRAVKRTTGWWEAKVTVWTGYHYSRYSE